MKSQQYYNKHKKRSRRSHMQSFVGMQLSKTARPDSINLRQIHRMLFSGKYRLY